MARYYFDIHHGEEPIRDVVGMEFSSRQQVLGEAGRILSDIGRDELPGHEHVRIVLNVRNDQDVVVFTSSLFFVAKWLDGKTEGGGDRH